MLLSTVNALLSTVNALLSTVNALLPTVNALYKPSDIANPGHVFLKQLSGIPCIMQVLGFCIYENLLPATNTVYDLLYYQIKTAIISGRELNQTCELCKSWEANYQSGLAVLFQYMHQMTALDP